MRSFFGTTVGKKIVMAVTGLILTGFVISHMAGNLLVFSGAPQLNEYSAFLRRSAAVLWSVRVVLLLSVVLHVLAALQLTRAEMLARPVAYRRREPQVSTFASRTIRWGGIAIVLFVIYHLLHFTTGTVHPSFSHTNVYGNVVSGLRIWWVSAIYIVAMAALGLHLYHGTWSSIRTLGVAKASIQPLQRKIPALIALLVWLGFTAIPLGVLTGFVR